MSLKNLKREPATRNGKKTWRLLHQGQEVEAFTRFDEKYQLTPRTKKRYLEVVGRLLDYFFEAGVFGVTPLSARQLNAVVDAFPLLLRDGSELTALRAQGNANDQWLARTALALDWKPLKRNSFSNTLAAVNHFLFLSESLAREELERAAIMGLECSDQPAGLVRALQGKVTLSAAEVHRMRQNSVLGSVAKYASKGIRRPQRLRTPFAGATQTDTVGQDFPLEHLPALLAAATSWRDKALWLLLAASGIRTSEARNLLLEDVLPDEQRVYVLDPHERHFKPTEAVLEQPRFKGRAMAATYLFPPLRQQFFEALEQYLKLEYVPTAKPGEARHLFQYSEPSRRGQPLVNASDGALGKAFKKAARKAGIPLTFDGNEYSPHSLRHLYGVYMLNDYPIDPSRGRFGLPITDVQMLMGHAKLSTTQKYARVKSRRLVAKLEASDRELLGLSPQERQLLPFAALDRIGHAP